MSGLRLGRHGGDLFFKANPFLNLRLARRRLPKPVKYFLVGFCILCLDVLLLYQVRKNLALACE